MITDSVVAVVFLGYFIYYVWNFMNKEVKPALGDMHMALIRCIDQMRMLDQDPNTFTTKSECCFRI